LRSDRVTQAVPPTIAPERDDANLDAAPRGGMAEPIRFEGIDPARPLARRAELRTALPRHRDRDTLALVRLVEFFEGPRVPETARAGILRSRSAVALPARCGMTATGDRRPDS
jgi:hypothetical protein